jgi:hypothetical protein
MDEETFWQLIDKTRAASGRNVSKQADLLVDELVQLSVEEILDFDKIVDEFMDNAYDAALWDAAYIIRCGCSDDGFYEFRGWLIAQGKDVYDNALADPESLVDLIDITETAQQGYLIHAAFDAYEQKTGQEMPLRDRKRSPLRGTLLNEEDKNSRFPKLDAKFGDCDQRTSIWLSSNR